MRNEPSDRWAWDKEEIWEPKIEMSSRFFSHTYLLSSNEKKKLVAVIVHGKTHIAQVSLVSLAQLSIFQALSSLPCWAVNRNGWTTVYGGSCNVTALSDPRIK